MTYDFIVVGTVNNNLITEQLQNKCQRNFTNLTGLKGLLVSIDLFPVSAEEWISK